MLHVDAMAAEAARIAHQRAHLLARLEQLREQRLADRPGRAGEQDHARDC